MGNPNCRPNAARRPGCFSSELVAIALAEVAAAILFVTVQARADEPSPLHLSLSAGVYQPWHGDVGHSAILSAQYARQAGRFWIGVEVEHRRFEANLGSGFRPEYDNALFRGLFHYHPFPDRALSPYVGLGTGIGLYFVDRKGSINGARVHFRNGVSGGTTFLALVGFQARFPTIPRLSLFAEARFESANDLWERHGATWRYDQIGGVTASLGLRTSY